MDSLGYRTLIFINTILVIEAVPSFYSETYNGYTLMMPLTDGENRSPLSLSSSSAIQWCSNHGATSLRITDERDQEIVAQFINSTVRTNKLTIKENIFFSNVYYAVFNWAWVNGVKNQGFKIQPVSTEVDSSVGYLWTNDYKISESRPLEQTRYYVCETSAHPSNSFLCDTILDKRCYWKKDDLMTWYQARNACLKKGGDLASFEKHNEKNLKAAVRGLGLSQVSEYWVGIYKGVWRWDDNGADPEIKYCNWKPIHPVTYNKKCLCLSQYNYQHWVECECDFEHPFICKRNVSDRHTASAIIIPCVIIFAVIIIVVVVVIIFRKQRNRPVTSSSNETSMVGTNAENSNEFPAYEELPELRGNDATYAALQQRI